MTERDQTPPRTGPFQLRSSQLGALPIVDRFLGRIGLQALLERHLPAGDARVALPAATVIGVLVRNLCVAREPLYGLAEWAARFDPALLGLAADEVALLNDDRVGRALDQLFDSDRGSLLTELMLGVICEFAVDCSQLHNDSTSISLHGDYDRADGRERGGKPTAAAALGHSKDHRPDLKQFVLTLTISADGAVPLAHRLLDGNVTDDQTHIATWDGLAKLVGRPDFLYVADSKLATREQMSHIHAHGGRFLSILPRSRGEDGQIRQWAQTHAFDWTEAARWPGKRQGDADAVYWTAPAPIPTSEGHRIVWARSSQKHERDAEARRARIEQGMLALESVQARLAGPRTRLKTLVAADEAAQAALTAAGARHAGSPTTSRNAPRKASARRNADAPAPTRATARPPRRSSRSPSRSTTTRSPTTLPPTAASRSYPTIASSPTPSCWPPTATSRTSRSATTSSRPCSAPHRSS